MATFQDKFKLTVWEAVKAFDHSEHMEAQHTLEVVADDMNNVVQSFTQKALGVKLLPGDEVETGEEAGPKRHAPDAAMFDKWILALWDYSQEKPLGYLEVFFTRKDSAFPILMRGSRALPTRKVLEETMLLAFSNPAFAPIADISKVFNALKPTVKLPKEDA